MLLFFLVSVVLELIVIFFLWREHKVFRKSKVFFQNKKIIVAILALLLFLISFVIIYEIIYFAFYYQIGLPAGSELTSADWLAFLGSYLGFSSSLIMAILVYKQDKRVNELVLQEYQTSFDFQITRVGILSKYDEIKHKEYTIEDSYKKSKIYKKHDLIKENRSINYQAARILYICIELSNLGKLSATDLFLESIVFTSQKTTTAPTTRANPLPLLCSCCPPSRKH